jgi:hypothetical protein
MDLFLTYFFSRTPAYITPNPRVDGEMNEGVRDQIARTFKEFGFTPKGQPRSYQKPYSEYFDTIPYPRGFRVPDLAKFTGDDAKTTYQHIGQFWHKLTMWASPRFTRLGYSHYP